MKRMFRWQIIFSLFFLLGEMNTGDGYCSEKTRENDDVPNNLERSLHMLPVEQDILDNLDDEQRKWYRKFNDGVLFFDGWQAISEEIIEQYPPENQNEVKRYIQRLGILIGTEWSKDNDIRRINNSLLDSWGDKIKAAIKVDSEHLTKVLHEINEEVENILKQERTVN